MTENSNGPSDPRQPEPLPLDYRPQEMAQPEPDFDDDYVDPDAPRWRGPMTPRERFGLGLIGGSVISVMFWMAILQRSWPNHHLIQLIAVSFILFKIILGIAISFLRGWTPTGLGILLSLGLVGLIAVVPCFASLK